MLLQIGNSEFNSEFNHLSPRSQSAQSNYMKEGSTAQRADQENTVSILIFHIWVQVLVIRVKKGTSMPCRRPGAN